MKKLQANRSSFLSAAGAQANSKGAPAAVGYTMQMTRQQTKKHVPAKGTQNAAPKKPDKSLKKNQYPLAFLSTAFVIFMLFISQGD